MPILSLTIDQIIALVVSLLGSGFVGHLLSETRQRKKDSQSDTHSIIDQLQENARAQDEKMQKQDEKIQTLYDMIGDLREEVRDSRTKKEQAEFWLNVERETNKKLNEVIDKKDVELANTLNKNALLVEENIRLRENISALEAEIENLKLKLKKQEDI